jgi:hypothetical protein
MPATDKRADRDTHRGVGAALRQAFDGHGADHVGVKAADADFAALLAQLNDPPPQFGGARP